MVTHDDIQEVWISPGEIRDLAENVREASMGGRSNIYDRAERKEKLSANQWSGQTGEYVTAKYVLLNANLYWDTRKIVNQDPKASRLGGDYYRVDNHGRIVETLAFDAKCSEMKLGLRGREDIFRYHLIVPPEEFLPDLLYVQILMPYFSPDGFPVYICGTISGELLRLKSFKRFGPKYVCPIYELFPFRGYICQFGSW